MKDHKIINIKLKSSRENFKIRINKMKKKKKKWLWFELSKWLLTEGEKIRYEAAKKWLLKNNPNHPLLKSLKLKKK